MYPYGRDSSNGKVGASPTDIFLSWRLLFRRSVPHPRRSHIHATFFSFSFLSILANAAAYSARSFRIANNGIDLRDDLRLYSVVPTLFLPIHGPARSNGIVSLSRSFSNFLLAV